MPFLDTIDKQLTALTDGQIKDIGSLNTDSYNILGQRADVISQFYDAKNPLTLNIDKLQPMLQSASELCESCSSQVQDAISAVEGIESASLNGVKQTVVDEMTSKSGRKLIGKVENALLDKAAQTLSPYLNSEYGNTLKTVMQLYGYNTSSDKALIEDVLNDLAAKTRDLDIEQAYNDADLKQRQIHNTLNLDDILAEQMEDEISSATKLAALTSAKAKAEWETFSKNVEMGSICGVLKQMNRNTNALKNVQNRLSIASLMQKFQGMDFSTASAIAKTVSNSIPNYSQLAASATDDKYAQMDQAADDVAMNAIDNINLLNGNVIPTKEKLESIWSSYSNANLSNFD